jgi:hypothetical protein
VRQEADLGQDGFIEPFPDKVLILGQWLVIHYPMSCTDQALYVCICHSSIPP